MLCSEFVEGKMDLAIRKWRIDDKSDLAIILNNPKVLNNLRDELPYPYTENDTEDFIRAMLSADKNNTFAEWPGGRKTVKSKNGENLVFSRGGVTSVTPFPFSSAHSEG